MSPRWPLGFVEHSHTKAQVVVNHFLMMRYTAFFDYPDAFNATLEKVNESTMRYTVPLRYVEAINKAGSIRKLQSDFR